MLRSLALVATGSFVLAITACVGGPGPLPDQGVDQASQGGGIQGGSSESENGSSSSSRGSGTSTPSTGSGGKSSGGTTPAPTVPTTISTSSYDTSCDVDTDCAPVYEGNACDACKCANAAINKSDAATYLSALNKAQQGCPDGEKACDADCTQPKVGCNPDTKRCVFGQTFGDGG